MSDVREARETQQECRDANHDPGKRRGLPLNQRELVIKGKGGKADRARHGMRDMHAHYKDGDD